MTPDKLAVIFTAIANILRTRIDTSFPGNYFISRAIPIYGRQVKSCLIGPVYSDPLLGTFPRNFDPEVCFSSPCIPEAPNVINVNFILYTRHGTVHFIKFGDNYARKLITSKLVIVMAHGWIQDYRTDPELNVTRDGWRRFGVDYIFVDWSGGNVNFESSAANTRIVGALTGQLINYLGIESKTNCVGFSYGGSICGFAGQWLRHRRGKVLKSCTAIDLSGLNFEGCPPSKAVDMTDCGTVNVIHNSYILKGENQAFGIIQKSGKCDYYINYVHNNPGCPIVPVNDYLIPFLETLKTDELVRLIEQIVGCNHLKGLNLYNRQLFSTPQTRYRTMICGEPQDGRCAYNVTSGIIGPKVVSLPPFDDCSRRKHPFNSCGCLNQFY